MNSPKSDPFLAFVQKHESVVRFLFVGTINTAIDLVLFTILANFVGITPVVASLVSTGITLCFSFFMNYYFVFRSTKGKRHSILGFLAVTLFNVWVIQSLVIALALHFFNDINYFDNHQWTMNILAKICGISVSMVCNYLGYRFVFHDNPSKGDA